MLRLAWPMLLTGAGLAAYGSVNPNGDPVQRVVVPLAVMATAGLLSTTRVPAVVAATLVAATGTLLSSEVLSALQPLMTGHPTEEGWSTVVTNGWPFALAAAIGAVCGAHGPGLAASYRRLVRRPAAPVAQLSA